MSSNNVDNRVVNMTFNNEQFEAGVKQTLSTLEELKESLKFNNATTGISALSNAISNFQISNISDQIDVLTNRFSTLGIVGMTAIENITNKVMNFTTSKISSTLGQITSGGWNRASNIAQSRFTLEGMLESAEDVDKAFKSASDAVDGTAYSLDQAVSAAAQLATSGVDVGEDMTNALTAVSGVAATTGAQFSDISNIFVDVASAGRLTGDALTRLSYRGVNAKQILANELGYTTEEITDMVSKGEISFQQFSDVMLETFGEHAKDANKTFSGSMDNIKSALSRIGAIFASGIIENDDLIQTLNDVRLTINKIKEAMLPLEDTFKNMVSAVSRLASTLINGLELSGIDTFVDIVGTGMEYVTDLANKWSGFNDKLKESVLGDVAEDAEAVSDAVTATSEQIKKAWDIWNNAAYGVGEARKEALGDDYNTVQYLVNQIAAGVTDLENVNVSAAQATEEAVDGVADATANVGTEAEETIDKFQPLQEIFDGLALAGEGVHIIVNNIKATVSKLGSAFKKVFSWKDLISDVADYSKAFSEFVGHFELTEERADKLENAISGVFSVIDILRRAIKFLITSGLKILGPILEVLFDVFLSVSSAIGDVITKFNLWEKENSVLTSAVDWLGTTLSNVIGTIKEFFKRLWNLPAVQQIKENLSELASLIIDKLSPYFEEASEKIKGFFDKFNDADDGTMTKILDKINTALENLISFCGEAETSIGNFTSYIGGGIASLFGFKKEAEDTSKKIDKVKNSSDKLTKSDSFGSFFSNITDIVSQFGGTVDKVISWVIEKFNSIDGATVALIGFGTSLTTIGLSFSYLSYHIGNFVKTLTDVPAEIAKTIKSFRGIFEGIQTYLQNKSQAEVIRSFAIAIAVLAASLFVLTNFTDTDKLMDVIKGMSLLLAVMTAAVVVITQTSKKMAKSKNFFKSMSSISLMFVAMAAAAFILANALKTLTELNWDKGIIKPCVALVLIIGALVGLAAAFSKLQGGFSLAAANVLLLSISVYLVAKALSNLNNVKTDGIQDKVEALILILGAIGMAGALMSQMSFGTSLGVLVLIGSIVLVEKALQYVIDNGVTWEDIEKNIDKFAIVLGALAVIAILMIAIGLACKKADNLAKNVIAMALSIAIIVAALKFVGSAKIKTIVKGLIAVSGVMIALGILLKLIPKDGKSINNLAKLAFAIGLLSIVVALVGKVPFVQAQKGVLVVLELMAMVTLFSILTSACEGINYKALYALTVAIGVMTVAVVLLSKMKDLTRVYAAAGILGTMLLSFGLSLYLASRWANKIKTSAIVAMVVALTIIAGSLYLLSNYTKNQKMLITAASCMAGVLISLGITFAILGKTFNSMGTKSFTKGGRMAALILLITMLAAVSVALYFLAQQSSENVIVSAIAIIGVMYLVLTSMGQFLTSLSTVKMDGNALKGLAASIILILAVAVALSLLYVATKGSDWTQIAAATLSMVLVLVTVVGLLKFIDASGSSFKVGVIVNVIAACVMLGVVAYTLKEVLGTQADWKTMLSAAGAMAIALIAVTACMAALIALTSAFGGIGVAAAAVVLLGFSAVLLSLGSAFKSFGKASKDIVTALTQLTKVDFKVLKENTGTLWQLVAIAGALSLIASVLGVGLVSIGIGLAAIGIGAIPVVAGLVLISITIGAVSKAVTALIEAFDHLVTTFSTSNGAIKSGITEIGTGLAGAITGFVTTLAVQTPVIKASVLVIISTITSLITEGVNSIIDIILDGIIHLLTSLEEKLPTINEKINTILVSVLSSIAQNASTFGYYGAVIAVSFLYGMSQGLVEYSDEMGETIANVIIALFNMMSSLLDVLLPSLTDGIKKGVLNLSEALWGVLAETGWDYAEENYQTVLGEQEQLAAESYEKANEVVAGYTGGYTDGMKDGSTEMSDATAEAVENATDQSDAAQKGASNTAGSYINKLGTTVTSGFDGSGIQETISGYLGFDASSSGTTLIDTFTNGANEEAKTQTIDVSHLPTEAIEQLKKEGYTLEEGGSTMVKSIQTGTDSETIDLTTNWDDSEAELYSAADETAEGMTEKGETSGENYGTGMATGINNTVEDVKEAAQNLADTVEETVNVTLEIKSPSRKGIRSGEFYGMGFGNGISNMAGYVKKASVSLAQSAVTSVAEMMGKIDTIMNDEDINWQPTFTPVIDSSQIQNGINYLGNINAESVGLATDASISVNNSQQASLASQVQALSDQVQRLADTDYSKILEGVIINVDASTNVDGTPLRRMSSAYTIQQINDTQNGLIMAAGGRV